MEGFFDRMNREHLDGRLAASLLELMGDVPENQREARALIERFFRLMKASRIDPKDITTRVATFIGEMVPRIVPGAGGGLIPPITMEGRHIRIDDYINSNPWDDADAGSTLLDLGCGFPPLTAAETAGRLDGWQIIAADPVFDTDLVFDERGDYAIFSVDGEIRSFQPGVLADFTRWAVRGEIGSVSLEGVDAVRCFNVLFYFDRAFRETTEAWVTRILRPGGLFFCGGNGLQGTEARHSVYRKENGRLVPREFAFSIDNLRPVCSAVSWYAMHDGEHETWQLAKYVALIRADESFVADFDEAMDKRLSEHGLFERGPDGVLTDVSSIISAAEFGDRLAQTVDELDRDGFVDGAVEVLRWQGVEASRSRIGYVAVAPGPPIASV